MNVPEIITVELSSEEQELLTHIIFEMKNQDRDTLIQSCSFASQLTMSLLQRNAISKIRIEYFTNPQYNIGSKKSRKDIFISNSKTKEEMIKHPHFLKYLKYFIYGPDLTQDTINGFRSILIEDMGTSGMVQSQLCSFARSETKRHNIERKKAKDEFYKLALECDCGDSLARNVYDAIR